MSDFLAYTIYTPESDAPQPGEAVYRRVIGTIRTPYRRMQDCPSRHNKRDYLPCAIRLAPDCAPGLVGLKVGGRVPGFLWAYRKQARERFGTVQKSPIYSRKNSNQPVQVDCVEEI